MIWIVSCNGTSSSKMIMSSVVVESLPTGKRHTPLASTCCIITVGATRGWWWLRNTVLAKGYPTFRWTLECSPTRSSTSRRLIQKSCLGGHMKQVTMIHGLPGAVLNGGIEIYLGSSPWCATLCWNDPYYEPCKFPSWRLCPPAYITVLTSPISLDLLSAWQYPGLVPFIYQ